VTKAKTTPAAAAAGDIGTALQVAVEAAEAAGDLIRDRWLGDIGVRGKGTAGDVVTDLDLAAEQLIVGRIRDVFPEHQIVAEEAGVLGARDRSHTWLVDPLDGTNNVAIGLPAYVVGIAMCVGRRPALGVVHDPVNRQTWTAVRGGGAHGPRGAPLNPPYRPAPNGPVLAWTQGHGVARDDVTLSSLKLVLDTTARRLLQLWAPLLSWVMLARGAIDGIVGYRAEAVDLPAGALIAAEAGMIVCRFDGTSFDDRIGTGCDDRSFVAGRPEVIGRLLDLVRAARHLEQGAAWESALSVLAQARWGP
jgi:myo-inositol-1(or 4)-monophosphatase